MREILFRAKAINREPDREYRTKYKNGDWVYGLISRIYKYTEEMEMTNTDGIREIDVDPTTVCQFTGLTDKNGTKIFEGDIVKVKITQKEDIGTYGNCKYKVGVIVYNEDFALFTCKNNFMNFINWAFNEYEVIGNFFDNKEILQ